MSFVDFSNAAWSEHGDQPEAVYDRLPEGLTLAETPNQVAQWAGLVVHVAGEHLGRWQDGLDLLDRGLAHPALTDDAMRRVLGRNRAILQRCAGDLSASDATLANNLDPNQPPASSRVRVLATAAAALTGQRQTERAISLFREALDAASYGPDAKDPVARSLAVTGNNLACDLEEKADRTPAETELMKQAAHAARTWWAVAGGWVEISLAEARLAFTYLKAGEPDTALGHAQAALDLAEANDASPDDRLTPLLALARVHLARQDRQQAVAAAGTFEAALAEASEQVRGWYVDDAARLQRDLTED